MSLVVCRYNHATKILPTNDYFFDKSLQIYTFVFKLPNNFEKKIKNMLIFLCFRVKIVFDNGKYIIFAVNMFGI